MQEENHQHHRTSVAPILNMRHSLPTINSVDIPIMRRNSWTPIGGYLSNQGQIMTLPSYTPLPAPTPYPDQSQHQSNLNDIKLLKWQKIKDLSLELAAAVPKLSGTSLLDIVALSDISETLNMHVRELRLQLLQDAIAEKETREGMPHYNDYLSQINNQRITNTIPQPPVYNEAPINNNTEHREGNTSTTGLIYARNYEREASKRRRSQDFECDFCGSRNTPEWRRGPGGKNTLCNACGLKYAKQRRSENETKKKLDINWILNSNNSHNTTNISNNNNTSNSTSTTTTTSNSSNITTSTPKPILASPTPSSTTDIKPQTTSTTTC